jgi:two-component system, OmpR family, phosphate regulon sensor histidine kinase PhoR
MATDLVLVGKSRSRLGIFLILFISFLVMIAVATVTLTGSVNRYWQGVIQDEITRDLTGKARMFAARVDSDRLHTIQDITSQEGQYAGARATVIDVNGKVIADSEISVAALEGEGKRPEFAAALRGQTGVKSRKRNTFAVPVLYVAVPVSGGAVRLACPLADVDIATAHARQVMFPGIAAAIIAALLVSAAGAGLIYGKTSG